MLAWLFGMGYVTWNLSLFVLIKPFDPDVHRLNPVASQLVVIFSKFMFKLSIIQSSSYWKLFFSKCLSVNNIFSLKLLDIIFHQILNSNLTLFLIFLSTGASINKIGDDEPEPILPFPKDLTLVNTYKPLGVLRHPILKWFINFNLNSTSCSKCTVFSQRPFKQSGEPFFLHWVRFIVVIPQNSVKLFLWNHWYHTS